MLLICKDMQKAFGTDEILRSVSFILEEKEKAALVGVNGAGKTSVFRLITGEWPLDGGELIKSSGIRVGYLPQLAESDSERVLYDELDSVFEPLRRMEAELRSLETDMGALSGRALNQTMERYSRLTALYEEKRGYEIQSRVRGVLKGLGFEESEWGQPVRQFSGGQQTRIALGKLLLTEPELLLLDEPTNHLDIESVAWLEEYLKTYNGGILVISHDRYFLDRVVTKTIEIENKKASVYNGNYSFYAAHKVINRENALHQYLQQQKEIKHHEEVIQTLRSFRTEAAVIRAKSREKLLAKMERVEKPESLPEKMRLILTPKLESGYDVLLVEDVSMGFDSNLLFEHVTFEIKKGDKTALIGPNGIGKTTLFRIITQELLPLGGRLREGVNLRIGYYDQAQQHLSDDKTIFQELADTYPRLTQTEIRNVLAAFVFTGDDVFKPIAALSGGERGRVALAKIMLGGANFLILDEPTNHLDMYSKEILEEAMRDFPGALLYISHDRYFINNTATKVLEMSPTGVTEYLGNYDYYVEKKRALKEAGLEVETITNVARDDRRRKKESETDARRRKSLLERLEREIAETEDRIAYCDRQLITDEVGRDAEAAARLFEEKTSLDEKLLELYAAWHEAQEE